MNLLHLLRNLDIAFVLLSQVAPDDLLHLQICCKELRNLVDFLLPRFYNIDKLLTSYFSDLRRFRQLQAATHTLISGSTALQAFSRSRWHGSDLDLYVFDIHALTVAAWLHAEGYEHIERSAASVNWRETLQTMSPDSRHPYAPSVKHVATFKRSFAGAVRTVQVIVAVNSPLACVLSFHSSMLFALLYYTECC